jgi:hypothetical protein
MTFELPVEVSGFERSYSVVKDGRRNEQFSVADIIRAAVVAGYEAGGVGSDWRIRAWRIASIRLALDLPPLASPGVPRQLSHPRAWRRLDPSEKASVNNLLGNTVTKLLCERILNAPRLWFLDLFRTRFSAVLASSRRPDFFTQTLGGDWLSLEAKGRSYRPSVAKLASAKEQANALRSVNGSRIKARVVCWTMEQSGSVSARFHDPAPSQPDGENLEVEWEDLLRDYYAPVHEIIQVSERVERTEDLALYRFVAGDFVIGLHPRVQEFLDLPQAASKTKHLHFELDTFAPAGTYVAGPDGIILIPGRSWPRD